VRKRTCRTRIYPATQAASRKWFKLIRFRIDTSAKAVLVHPISVKSETMSVRFPYRSMEPQQLRGGEFAIEPGAGGGTELCAHFRP